MGRDRGGWNPPWGGGYRRSMPRRPLLSCRQFRRLHTEFLDAMLSHDDAAVCRAHLDACAHCAAHDVTIRRSLMALQTLRPIEPSSDFRSRLAARIASDTTAPRATRQVARRWGVAGALLAASVALIAFAATPSKAPAPVRLAAVAARAPESVVPPVIKRATAQPNTAVVANRSSARFEALPGQLPMRAPQDVRPSSVRIQTVNYIGQ